MFSDLWSKILVVLKSLPAWLAVATVVLTLISTELVPLLPANWPVVGWIATALVVLRAAAEVVARVTPVAPDERGVLPQ